MSAVGAPTHADPGQQRADFCIGDIKGITCTPRLFDLVATTLEGLGHTVSRNFPYYGGELTRRHSDPAAGVESVFIEINKRLFIDTKTFKRTAGFAAVKSSVEALLAAVVDDARERRA
jgi:N-formylglutamate amidohydrolase